MAMSRQELSAPPVPTPASAYIPLLWLALGAFAIGTEGYVIAGLLPAIAVDTGVSIATAGQLVTAFALAYALGSPLIAVATSVVERRGLLLTSLVAFVGGNLLAAFGHGYWQLMAARLAMALAAATYMPAASAYAAATAVPERRGRALAVIYGGVTLAVALGTPLGVIIGARYGWRRTFLVVAVFSVMAIIGLRSGLRKSRPGRGASLAERVAVARRSDVLAVLVSTVLMLAGAFTIYTYLAPYLATVVGLRGTGVAVVLFVFGIASAVGNLLGGIASDRWGARRVVATILVSLVGLFALFALLPRWLPPAALASRVVVVGLVALWGLVGFAFPSAQQSRLVRIDPRLAPITLSLNASAVYVGISLGAVLGSVAVHHGHLLALGWVGAACEVAALAVMQLETSVVPQPVLGHDAAE